jgi:outer membrane protein assembly complex protein YaeT
LNLESELLAFVRSGRTVEVEEEERSMFLSRLRYNLPVRTVNPLVVDNNLARLSATANLRLVGTYYRPSVTGRLTLEEGGELYLAENDYVIDTGRVDFLNPNRIEPSLNVVARTEASGYDIELRVTGSPDDLDTTLTSEPPLPEPDIVSVLITGRTLEEARGGGVNVAREQGLSFLTGRVGTRLSQRAEETIGLSQVRIEPNLIASESDPAVRLTLGQDITRRLRLIYSMNLADSGDQIYVAEYGIGRRFNASGVKQSDNTYRFSFRHEVQAGGAQQEMTQARLPQRTVGDISITGHPVLEPPDLLDELDVSTGDRFDYLKLRDGLETIRRLYREENFLEARVRLQQERSDGVVNLRLNIEAGPKVEFLFEGTEVPGGIRRQVAEVWQRGVFEAQRLQDAEATLRRWLVEESYLQATVEHEVQNSSDDLRRVLFRIMPGVRYSERNIVFEDLSAFSSSRLQEFLQEQNLLPAIYLEPSRITESITAYYHRRGYLEAKVQPPRQEYDPERGSATAFIAIMEGPVFAFGEPEFEGNRAFPDDRLRSAIPMQSGLPYDPEVPPSSLSRLEELYWRAGYNNVLIEYTSRQDLSRREYLVTFRITENQQDIVESVEIRGNRAVSESFIRQRVPFRPGDLFDADRAGEARSNLYRTGAFSFIEFESEPLADAPQESQRPLKILMNIQEVRPYNLRYGGFFDTERGPGAILDFENRNTLGSARVLGFRTRYDSELREFRGYFGQPLIWMSPSTVSATGFRRREIRGRETLSDFITDRTGFSVQQEFNIRSGWLVNYGYRFERTHTFDEEPDPDCPLPLDDPFCRFDDSFNIAPLTSSASVDRRDDPLDATRGMFTSHSLEFATASLGSDLRFLRYFGQFYRYVPLVRPASVPGETAPRRPRFVYAGALRLGLGRGFGGQGLTVSERFFAGGGTTIRGFEQDTVGPVDFQGDPEGGEALFVLNNELRFPLISIFDGVAFLDLGNVYPRVRDLNPFEVRKAAGLGLRVRTPYFLLRMDYGHKLDRREGESSGEFFFSIGQAF